MNDSARIRLCQEVYEVAYNSMDTFEACSRAYLIEYGSDVGEMPTLGSGLAYLLGAIINNKPAGLLVETDRDYSDVPRNTDLLDILSTNFAPDHLVWHYIEFKFDGEVVPYTGPQVWRNRLLPEDYDGLPQTEDSP